ncbi:MAG: response regulator [Candidatus Hermodarchaeota archaeon]
MERPKIKVFIVDDNLDILRLYSVHFELNGLNVVGQATNGIEAIKKLNDSIEKPDVIIMDYHMPGINGIEASKRILQNDQTFKIIMISADPSIRPLALSNGINFFIDKPNNIKFLCKKIKDVCK